MSIESILERIATALEGLGTGIAAAAGTTVAIAADAAPEAPPAVVTVGNLTTQAPPQIQAAPRKPRKTATEQTQPATAASATAPATAPAATVSAAAPTAGSLNPEHPVIPGVKLGDSLVQQTSDAIIALANNFSPGPGRDHAVRILGTRGAKKVSELKPDQHQGVLDEVVATYAQLASAKATQELI